MIISPRWRKVIQDLWDNKSRTALVVASIAVGVIAFGGLFATRVNLLNNLAGEFSGTNPHDVLLEIRSFDDELVRWVERRDSITEAMGRAEYTITMTARGTEHDAQLYAIRDFTDVPINYLEPETGLWPPAHGEIWIERSYNERTQFQIGDPVVVDINEQSYTLRYAGTIHDINVTPGGADPVVKSYVTLRTLRDLDLPVTYNRLYVTVDRSSPLTVTEIADNLREDIVRQGVNVRRITVEESTEHWASDNVSALSLILIVVGAFSLVLSGLLVVNTISGFLAQQRKQIGIMKIIGASREQIIVLYMVMVAMFGVLALVVALPLSAIVGRAIANLLGPGFINFDIVVFRLPVFLILVQITVALISPLISALVPVLTGTRISAAAAISDFNSQGGNSRFDRWLASISGLPRPFLLSLRNMFRKKTRLVLTLTTLILAGALFMAIANVRISVSAVSSDIVRMSSSDVQVVFDGFYDRTGTEQRAENDPEVTTAEGWLSVQASRTRADGSRSEGLALYGLPYDSVFTDPDVVEGHWLEPGTGRNDIVVSDNLLENEPDLKVGDTVRLTFDGQDQDWRIVGVIWIPETPSTEGGAMYSYYNNVANFTGHVGQTNSLLIRTTTDERAVQTRVANTMETQFEDTGIDVLATEINAETVENLLESFQVIMTLLLTTATMVAIVGGLGLAGTMSMSVLERTREIGVMRSVGASNDILRTMLITEGVLVGMLSFIISLILSFPATFAFGSILGQVMRGKPLDYVVTVGGPLQWLTIVLIVSTMASLLPAWRAAQISIREALAYE